MKPGNKLVTVLSQNGGSAIGSDHWKANLVTPQNDSGVLNKMKVQNGLTVSPMRLSKRNATTVDQDSLEKATKLKARNNLDSAADKGKKPQPCSFISRDDSSLLDSTKSLGIVLGANEQAISDSIKFLREVELFRLNGKKGLVEELDDASIVCSADDNLDLEASNLICSDILDGLGDGGCDPVCLQTPVSPKKRSCLGLKKKTV